MCEVSVDVKCVRCGTVSGEVVVDGAMVTCTASVHDVDRICELAQANVMLREKNAMLSEKMRRLELRLGEVEHFVVAQGHVEAFGRWRMGASDLGDLGAREAGVQAAERYLAKGKG